MPIKEAAKLGYKAGMAIRDYIFNYEKEKYQAKINEIEALKAKLSAHLSELMNLRDQIPQFWDDDNAYETAQALDVTIDRVKHHMNTADSVLRTLNETVAEFDRSNDGVKGLINDALALLNSVNQK